MTETSWIDNLPTEMRDDIKKDIEEITALRVLYGLKELEAATPRELIFYIRGLEARHIGDQHTFADLQRLWGIEHQ